MNIYLFTRTHARTYAHTHARTHKHTHTHTLYSVFYKLKLLKINIISDSECFIEFLKNLIKLSLEKQ